MMSELRFGASGHQFAEQFAGGTPFVKHRVDRVDERCLDARAPRQLPRALGGGDPFGDDHAHVAQDVHQDY